MYHLIFFFERKVYLLRTDRRAGEYDSYLIYFLSNNMVLDSNKTNPLVKELISLLDLHFNSEHSDDEFRFSCNHDSDDFDNFNLIEEVESGTIIDLGDHCVGYINEPKTSWDKIRYKDFKSNSSLSYKGIEFKLKKEISHPSSSYPSSYIYLLIKQDNQDKKYRLDSSILLLDKH